MASVTRTSHRHRRHRIRNPGTLPQTQQLPTAHTAGFRMEMAALWRAIRTDRPATGLPAFFPEAAYAQIKAIGDPRADYQQRLVADYELDIGAAHRLLGRRARVAHLLAVHVPAPYAHWVDPGACYNRIGYYEVPNSRLVYRTAAGVHSFGIASMISWRGTWYVIHLGAVERPVPGGIVDSPSSGSGTPTPSSTC